MSLYALTASGLQRIKRAWYGTPIPTELKQDANGNMTPVEGGSTTDPGVQQFVNELLAGLSSQDPIALAGSLQMIQPANGPAIQLYVTNNSQPIIQFIGQDQTVTNINSDGTINSLTRQNFAFPQNQQNQFPQNIGSSGGSGSGGTTTGGGGFTGSLTVVTGGSVSVVGCDVSFSLTTSTIIFQNGSIASVQ